MTALRTRGFTLLEVMVGLALLGFALVVLMKSAAGNIFNAEQSQMMGVTTDLARGKMNDIEEGLLKDGFQDTDQQMQGTFEDEGWPNVQWIAKVEAVDLPSWDDLQALAQGHAKKLAGSGAGSNFGFGSGSGFGSAVLGSNGLPSNFQNLGSAFGSGSAGDIAAILGSDTVGLGSGDLQNFQNSALGGMLQQFGGMGGAAGGIGGAGFGSDAASGAGALVIQQQYTMFQQVLKVTIRKVTMVVQWKVGGDTQEMKVVSFYTDPAAMDKVLNGLGTGSDINAGSGSGSGSGTGSATGSGTGSSVVPTTNTLGH
jgi:prepilin-type N-terminal cleavage/methylation domain-containing protein